MNIEDDDEGPDPDYGIWGDADLPPRPIPKRDPIREASEAAWRKKRARESRVSQDFNSHMIHLFNERQKS